VDEVAPIKGDRQAQAMSALWRLGSGTVEQVRSELPTRYRGAYNTIQTVLNRLADRELAERSREGRRILYRPRLSEAEYLSGTIRRTLAGASTDARRAALASIIGGLAPGELDRIGDLAAQTSSRRAPWTRPPAAGGRPSSPSSDRP
jgi:predicted transcriptional regulator